MYKKEEDMEIKGFYVFEGGRYNEVVLQTGDFIDCDRDFLYFYRGDGAVTRGIMVMFQLPSGELKCEPGIVALSCADVEKIINFAMSVFSLTAEKAETQGGFRYHLFSQGESPMEKMSFLESRA